MNIFNRWFRSPAKPAENDPVILARCNVTKTENAVFIRGGRCTADEIHSLLKKRGISLGERYSYQENNLVERRGGPFESEISSYVLESWKRQVIYKGKIVGLASYSGDSRKKTTVLENVEITGAKTGESGNKGLMEEVARLFGDFAP